MVGCAPQAIFLKRLLDYVLHVLRQYESWGCTSQIQRFMLAEGALSIVATVLKAVRARGHSTHLAADPEVLRALTEGAWSVDSVLEAVSPVLQLGQRSLELSRMQACV